MTVFQISAAFFGLFMLYVASIHYKKKTLSVAETSFWYSAWSFFIVIALFPFLLDEVTGILNFARVFDLLVVISLMILTVLVIFSYFSQKANDKKLEDLVRLQALADYEKKKKY